MFFFSRKRGNAESQFTPSNVREVAVSAFMTYFNLNQNRRGNPDVIEQIKSLTTKKENSYAAWTKNSAIKILQASNNINTTEDAINLIAQCIEDSIVAKKNQYSVMAVIKPSRFASALMKIAQTTMSNYCNQDDFPASIQRKSDELKEKMNESNTNIQNLEMELNNLKNEANLSHQTAEDHGDFSGKVWSSYQPKILQKKQQIKQANDRATQLKSVIEILSSLSPMPIASPVAGNLNAHYTLVKATPVASAPPAEKAPLVASAPPAEEEPQGGYQSPRNGA